MYPFERSLVNKFQGKPFVLVAVDSDPKPVLKKIIEDKTIQWPCFWDGGSPGGPIASQWKVDGWPTVYLIDEKGIVRENTHGDPELIESQIADMVSKVQPAK